MRNFNKLKIRIGFINTLSRVGGKPGKEYSEDTLFNCWASIENVWLKDIQQAKANNTETDLTITIRDPLNTFEIKKTHAVKILNGRFKDKIYDISLIQNDFQDSRFVTLICKQVI